MSSRRAEDGGDPARYQAVNGTGLACARRLMSLLQDAPSKRAAQSSEQIGQTAVLLALPESVVRCTWCAVVSREINWLYGGFGRMQGTVRIRTRGAKGLSCWLRGAQLREDRVEVVADEVVGILS